MSIMLWLLVGFGLMLDKGQKQSSTLSCDSSYWFRCLYMVYMCTWFTCVRGLHVYMVYMYMFCFFFVFFFVFFFFVFFICLIIFYLDTHVSFSVFRPKLS